MTTYVRFIKNKNKTITACFLRDSAEIWHDGVRLMRKCYPGEWCPEDKVKRIRAKPEEYAALLSELVKLGYTDIKIV